MTKNEMMRLQGLSPTKFVVATPEGHLGKQIGNAMSVNVIVRILVRALKAGNLTKISALKGKRSTQDRWECGLGFQEIQTPHNCHGLIPGNALSSDSNNARLIGHVISLHHQPALRYYIVDSGASMHLVAEDEITEEERSTRHKRASPVPLNTANGVIWTEEGVTVYIEELGIEVEAALFKSSPAVLSLGRLVREPQFKYVWEGDQVPYVSKGSWRVLWYPTIDVPFITAAPTTKHANPSPSGIVTQSQSSLVESSPSTAEIPSNS